VAYGVEIWEWREGERERIERMKIFEMDEGEMEDTRLHDQRGITKELVTMHLSGQRYIVTARHEARRSSSR